MNAEPFRVGAGSRGSATGTMTNISQLRVPLPANLTRRTTEAADKDVQFLAFRQLNKRARVRISPLPFRSDTFSTKFRFFAVANAKGWFAAVTQTTLGDFAVVFAPLLDLRTTFLSAGHSDELPFTPRRTMRISGTPTIITFTADGSRFFMSLKDGRISVYDTFLLFTAGSNGINPLHTWPPSPYAPQQILPNPGDMTNLVAVLLEPGAAQSVVVLDAEKYESLAGWERDDPDDPITTISWSPKGKQLAIGLKSGSITTFLPADTSVPKFTVPPPAFPTPLDLVSMTWLTNDSFYTIYASPSPDIEHTHVVITLDIKAGTSEEVSFVTPYFLLPDVTPIPFTLTLRNWEPAKILLIVGVSASSDVGLIGNVDDGWCNISLEETVTPKMPLDINGNETMLTALELDLSNDSTLGLMGNSMDLPPAPILYGFASDGTVQGWYTIHTNGQQYPAMVQASASARLSLGSPSSQSPTFSTTLIRSPTFERSSIPGHSPPELGRFSLDQPTQAISTSEGQSRTSSQSTSQLVFGQTSFQSSFGSPSVSTFSGFTAQQTKPTQTPAFGQSSFQTLPGFQQSGDKPANVFGQSSFGAFSTSPIAQPVGGGFRAFADGGMMSFSGVGTTSGDGKMEPAKSVFGGGGALFSQSPSSAIKPGFLGTDPSSSAFSSGAATSSPSALINLSTGAQPLGNAPNLIGAPATPSANPVFGNTSALGTFKPSFGPTLTSNTSEPVFGSSVMVGNTQSAFGVSSPLEGQRSVLGVTAPQGQSQLTKAVGFGAYSGSASGFGAFSGVQKSFGELLREQSGETSQTSGSAAASTKVDTTSKTKPLASFFNSAAVSKGSGSESALASTTTFALSVGADTTTQEGKGSTDTKTAESSLKMIFPNASIAEEDNNGIQREASISQPSDQSLSDSFSLSSLNSSFVDISEMNSTEKDDEGEEFEADTPSSPSTLSEQSESSEHRYISHGYDGTSPSVTPEQAVKIPLPLTPVLSSRSLSTTPKPENIAIPPVSTSPSPPSVPEIITTTKQTVSPSIKPATNTVSPILPARPPNSISAPVPIVGPGPLNALGLGKPSNSRPTRSSPLASASVSAAIANQETGPSSVIRPRPAAPKTPFGQVVEPLKFEKPEGLKTSKSNPERARSPPFTNLLELSTQDSARSVTPATLVSKSLSSASLDPKSSSSKPSTKSSTVNNLVNIGSGTRIESPHPELLHQGMQAECLSLFASLGKELESLRQLAGKTSEKRESINRSTNLPFHIVDGSVKTKWTSRDINQFGGNLAQARSDISYLTGLKAEHWSSIRALRGQMLKAGTKKEEIARFDRAKTGTEFADILRERTLGPEHRETQNQLRKDVRAMRDRIQRLEDHLYTSKKKLEQMKTGRPSFTAPSLDTINRTYRNIDVAINQQAQDLANLTSRMARLNLNLRTTNHMSATRDKRLPDIVSRRLYNATPNVAVTTAAALNAERSAQKLKRALLAARKQPHLNTKAAPASEAPITFTPPRGPDVQATPTTPRLFSPSPIGKKGQRPRHDDSQLQLEELQISTPSIPTRRTAGTGIKHHNKPIALRRGGGTRDSPPVANFDWGPLPSITPMTTLSADVRRKDGGDSV